jgi:hypothetical protein
VETKSLPSSDEAQPMVCANGHVLTVDQRFCPTCGSAARTNTLRMCPNGHEAESNAQYCAECGQPVAAQWTPLPPPSSVVGSRPDAWPDTTGTTEVAQAQIKDVAPSVTTRQPPPPVSTLPPLPMQPPRGPRKPWTHRWYFWVAIVFVAFFGASQFTTSTPTTPERSATWNAGYAFGTSQGDDLARAWNAQPLDIHVGSTLIPAIVIGAGHVDTPNLAGWVSEICNAAVTDPSNTSWINGCEAGSTQGITHYELNN